jgi:hypothetical protein
MSSTVEMVCYTGGPLDLKGFPHPVVIDLAGLTADDRPLPILYQHRGHERVGRSTRLRISANRLLVRGKLNNSARAQQLTKHRTLGASVGCEVGKFITFVDAGASLKVNGKKIDGPVFIASKAHLCEVSIVLKGADPMASATIYGVPPKRWEMAAAAARATPKPKPKPKAKRRPPRLKNAVEGLAAVVAYTGCCHIAALTSSEFSALRNTLEAGQRVWGFNRSDNLVSIVATDPFPGSRESWGAEAEQNVSELLKLPGKLVVRCTERRTYVRS